MITYKKLILGEPELSLSSESSESHLVSQNDPRVKRSVGKSNERVLTGCLQKCSMMQGRIQDLIGGTPDCDRPKLPTVCSSIVRVK